MLTIIVEPRTGTNANDPDEPYYKTRGYPEMVAILSELIGREVPLIHGTLADAPSEGWVLADILQVNLRDTLTQWPELCPRMILLLLGGGPLYKIVEEFGLAGAVGISTTLNWRNAFPCPYTRLYRSNEAN